MDQLLTHLAAEMLRCRFAEQPGDPVEKRKNGGWCVCAVYAGEGSEERPPAGDAILTRVEQESSGIPECIPLDKAEPRYRVEHPVAAPSGDVEQGATAFGEGHGGNRKPVACVTGGFAGEGGGRCDWTKIMKGAEKMQRPSFFRIVIV